MHGGKGSGAPVGNRNALTHGAYDQEMRALHGKVQALIAKMSEAGSERVEPSAVMIDEAKL